MTVTIVIREGEDIMFCEHVTLGMRSPTRVHAENHLSAFLS